MLPLILYGCETWVLTLRKERRLRPLEKKGAEEDIWPKGVGAARRK